MTRTARRKISLKSKWKRLAGNRIRSHALLGLTVLAILILVVVTGKVREFLAGFNRPYSPDSLQVVTKSFSWEGRERLNLVLKTDQLYLLSLDPQKKTITLFRVPDEVYLNVPFNFGSWPARSIYELGQAERPPAGVKFLTRTMEAAFALPMDGYLLVYGESPLPLEKVVEQIRQNPFSGFAFLRQVKTDLSIIEYWRFVLALKGVRTDKIRVVDLGQVNLTSWLKTADGSRVLKLDILRLDEFIQKQIPDEGFKEEALSVGVFNTTDHPQLAERAARLITNLGGRVIFLDNTLTHLEKSLVVGGESRTAARLREIFAPGQKSRPTLPSDQGFSRAEVNIFLGEDYFLRYNFW